MASSRFITINVYERFISHMMLNVSNNIIYIYLLVFHVMMLSAAGKMCSADSS